MGEVDLARWFLAADWTWTDLLPGLYVAALAGGLALALRRFYDAVPARVWLGCALLSLALFGPALVGGKVLLPLGLLRSEAPFRGLPPSVPSGHALQVDLITQIAPHQAEVRHAWSRGALPLWNDHVGAGMPLLADPQTQVLQPLVWLACPFPLVQAVGITAALRFLVAFVFLFLLLRRLGLGEAAALLGACAYGLGGSLMLWLGWPLANAAAWLPAVLYATHRVVPPKTEPGGRRDVALLGLTAFSLLTGGQPETILYAVATAMAFLAVAYAGTRSRPGLRRPAGAWAVAAALASPALLLAQEYLPRTQRAAVLAAAFGQADLRTAAVALLERPEVRAEWAERAGQRLAALGAARAWGNQERYWGEINLTEDGVGFVGTGTLLLALLGLAGPASRYQRLLQLALLAVVLLLLQPPGFDVLTYHLPFVGFTAAHKNRRLFMIAAFALAALGAFALQSWQAGGIRRRRVLASGGGLAAFLLWAYLAHPAPAAMPGMESFQRGWLAIQLVSLLVCLALLLLPRLGRHAAPGLVIVVSCELLLAHGTANLPHDRHLAFPVTPGIRFLQERGEAWRMVGTGLTLRANLSSIYGLSDVRIQNPSEPAEYYTATQSLRLSSRGTIFGHFGHPLYDLLGVRWIAAPPGSTLSGSMPADSTPSGSGPPLKRVYQGEDLWVFRRPIALPRLFLPQAVEVDPPGRWPRWLGENDDFLARSLAAAMPATAVSGSARDWQARPDLPATLDSLVLAPTSVRARVEIAEERLLASSVFQDGSWRLFVDGVEQPTVRTNGIFVGGWLPAGRHAIELAYRPRRLAWGLTAAGLALVCGLGWCLWPRAGKS